MRRHKRLKIFTAFTGLTLVLAATIIISTSTVLAGGSSGTGQPARGGACKTSGGHTTWVDSCYGLTWRKYTATSDNIYYRGTSSGNVHDGYITGCKTNGGSYYRLGYEKFYLDTLTSAGSQLGAVAVKYVKPSFGIGANGSINFKKLPDTEDWEEVRQNYELAVANGISFAHNWEDVAWFCWNDDLLTAGASSSFGAWSWANTAATTSVDSTIATTITTNEDHITVNFKHQLSYYKPTGVADTSTFGTASTTWHTDITENGVRVDGIGDTNFTLTNSGPTRTSIWDDMPYLAETSRTVAVPATPGESVKVCSKITYQPKNLKWKNEPSGSNNYIMDSSTSSGTADSEACITIIRGTAVTEYGGEGHFHSTSTVNVPIQNDIRIDHQVTSANTGNSEARVVLSTDQENVNVNFWHNMFYEGNYAPGGTPYDEYPEICSDWTVEWGEDKSGTVNTGRYCYIASPSNNGAEVSRTAPEIIHLNPGDTVNVCQRINFHPETLIFERTRKTKLIPGIATPVTYWEYAVSGQTGDGYSEACVTITRPESPTGIGPFSGNTDEALMYAGETSKIGWNTNATYYATRRLVEWQAIAFLVPVNININNSNPNLVVGNLNKTYPNHTNQTPCEYYHTLNWSNCSVIDGHSAITNFGSSNGSHHYPSSSSDHAEDTIVVPNEVGAKYCNSFGYHWEYWYAYIIDGIETWNKQPGTDYWTNYDAACRTIAKKPSMSVWNGSVFTNGKITTSIARRYLNPVFGQVASSSNYDRAFGSWAEYLVIAGKDITGFSSGAALSYYGVEPGNYDLVKTSPLSIANSNPDNIGNSQIGNNSAFLDRLKTYLFNSVSPSSSDALSTLTNVDTTRIIKIDGDANISSDITLSNTGVSTIYQLPQIIIYATGNINIDSNVSRIDAWLISDGTLNTCNNYIKADATNRGTEARVAGYNDTECSRKLQINGPVIAKNIILNRSYGADPLTDGVDAGVGGYAQATSGEVFNLGANTYLWAYQNAGSYNSSYTEAYVRELPPRY